MPGQRKWDTTALVGALAAVLAVALAACGSGAASGADAKAERALEECHAQWKDVGETVVGMDQDPNPSALADRWTSVIATVEYYRTTDEATGCQDRIATQIKAISALRQFSEKLRPYDMTYQLSQVRPAIDLYLNDPLPDPVRGDNGKAVRPPSKSAVSAAMQTLTDDAAAANSELEPGWTQISSVDLEDVTALTKAVQDLDFLAQDSPRWRRCEEALQVLVAAVRAQEGLTGAPTSSPTSSPTDATTPAG
jgi:hypothetical protein